jgi:hypothetical protein
MPHLLAPRGGGKVMTVKTVLVSIIGAASLGGIAADALACELPPLVVIPAKESFDAQREQVNTAAGAYFEGITAFTKCVKAEYDAAGGDSGAPALTKAVLVARINTAVAEAQNVKKLYDANSGGAAAVGPPVGPTSAVPQKPNEHKNRRGH